MPVSNEHLRDTVQVWDGMTMRIMGIKEARKGVRDGVLQIATNLQASQLKHPSVFDKARQTISDKAMKAELPPGLEPTPAKKKRTYKTREMKAEK